MTIGRPVTYSEDIAAELCRRHAAGETLTSLCKLAEFPDLNTVYDWKEINESFREMIYRAQEKHADSLIGQTIDIVDTDHDPQRARNRVAARQWLAGKINRDKWGERMDIKQTLTVNVVGAIGEAMERVRSMSDQSKIIEAQAIEITEQKPIESTDYKSEEGEEVDIFS